MIKGISKMTLCYGDMLTTLLFFNIHKVKDTSQILSSLELLNVADLLGRGDIRDLLAVMSGTSGLCGLQCGVAVDLTF